MYPKKLKTKTNDTAKALLLSFFVLSRQVDLKQTNKQTNKKIFESLWEKNYYCLIIWLF